MRQLLAFSTRNLRSVLVWDTEVEFFGERIYAIDTTENKGSNLIRFGNKTQMLSILVGYRHSIAPGPKEAYDKFMDENYYLDC